MSKLKKMLIAVVVFIGLGAIAKGYNESHHMDMALEECVSQENIARVDSKGFECKDTAIFKAFASAVLF